MLNKYHVYAMWLLRLTGLLISLSLLAIFLPKEWMAEIHSDLGLGELPPAPIVEYLARSLSAMYFAHGVLVLTVSTDVTRYWPIVGVIGVLNVFLGAVFTWVDLVAPMPWFWTLAEGPPVVIVGAILIWLWFKASKY